MTFNPLSIFSHLTGIEKVKWFLFCRWWNWDFKRTRDSLRVIQGVSVRLGFKPTRISVPLCFLLPTLKASKLPHPAWADCICETHPCRSTFIKKLKSESLRGRPGGEGPLGLSSISVHDFLCNPEVCLSFTICKMGLKMPARQLGGPNEMQPTEVYCQYLEHGISFMQQLFLEHLLKICLYARHCSRS